MFLAMNRSDEGGMSVSKSGKIVVFVMAAAFMWTNMSVTPISGASAQAAAAAASLSAEVDADTDEVRIQGRIASGEGKWLTVVVTDPDRSIDYIDQIRSGQEGSFSITYRISHAVEGTYTVRVYDAESDTRLTETFSYQRSDQNESPQQPAEPPSEPKPPSSPPSPSVQVPAEVGDILQQIENIADDIANLTAQEALDLAQAVIRSAAGLNDDEKSQVRDDLAALVQTVIRKAGTVDADDLDVQTQGQTTAVRLNETIIAEKINQLNQIAEELAESLEAAGFDPASGIRIGRKELRVAWEEDENRNVSIGLPADSFMQLAEHEIDLAVETRGVAITIPPGSLIDPDMNTWTEDAFIEICVSELDEDEIAQFADNLRSAAAEDNRLTLKGGIFDLNAEMAEGATRTKLARFKEKLTLEIPYSDASGREEKLGVYRYDSERDTWQYVGGKVDAEAKKAAARTGRFSHYAVMEYFRSFDDIKGHPAQDDIETLASKHILFGVDSRNFAPGRTITRAEAAAILVRALGLDILSGSRGFSDVEADAWYADIVGTVAEAGLMVGYAGKFRPDDRVTKEEMAVLVMRAYERAGGREPEAGSHATRAWSASVFRKLLDHLD
jgi:hypothetical protein